MLIVCDVCNKIDDTANTSYYARNHIHWKDPTLDGKVLCSSCTPTQYADGSPRAKVPPRFRPHRTATEREILDTGISHFIHLGAFEYLKKGG